MYCDGMDHLLQSASGNQHECEVYGHPCKVSCCRSYEGSVNLNPFHFRKLSNIA